jgi:hypothetical protein
MSQTAPASQGWQLDRRFPVAFILTLIVQTGAAIWFISNMNSRVDANTEAIGAMGSHSDRIILLESHIQFQTETMRRLEAKIDRLDQRLDERP